MTKRNTTQRDRLRRTIARSKPACHICGEPIDYTLTTMAGQHGAKCRRPDCAGCTPHPMRYEVDHVIPLDKGGEDALSNVRAAHRLRECNSKKRARLVAPIVRRSGALD